MNVTHKDGGLHFDGVNDVDFFLRQIPRELANRQKRLDPSTKVLVTLDVDGTYTRNLPFSRESAEGLQAIGTLKSHLKAEEQGAFELNSVRTEQTFSIRIKVKFEYERLDVCDGDEVVAAINARLAELQKAGVNLREPQPVD